MDSSLMLVTRWSAGGWLSVAVLIALSALFSGTQSALRTLDRNRLRHQVLLGNRSARLTEMLLAEPERLFGTILLCRTAVHVTATGLAGMHAARLAGPMGLALLTIVLTLLLMVVSELAPRR